MTRGRRGVGRVVQTITLMYQERDFALRLRQRTTPTTERDLSPRHCPSKKVVPRRSSYLTLLNVCPRGRTETGLSTESPKDPVRWYPKEETTRPSWSVEDLIGGPSLPDETFTSTAHTDTRVVSHGSPAGAHTDIIVHHEDSFETNT